MGTWREQVLSGKMPTCEEVCLACVSGKHVFYMMGQLSDLYAFYAPVIVNGKTFQKLTLAGSAEDEFWLEELFGYIAGAYVKPPESNTK